MLYKAYFRECWSSLGVWQSGEPQLSYLMDEVSATSDGALYLEEKLMYKE